MSANWYPSDKKELEKTISRFMTSVKGKETIHGLVVPHAGYTYSGPTAGKTYSYLQNKKIEKAVVFGPSHYVGFSGLATLEKIETPFGKMKITKDKFLKLEKEHSVENQIPFLQYLGVEEVLPIVVGQISVEDAEKIAKEFLEKYSSYLFIFSTDLSHFLAYKEAVEKDKNTIKIIEDLDLKKVEEMDACGIYPLLICMQMCKLKKWKPKLVEYKNSGDVIGDKSSVVGYAGFRF